MFVGREDRGEECKGFCISMMVSLNEFQAEAAGYAL